MSALPTHVVPHTGLSVTPVAADAEGDESATGAGVLLLVKNGDSAAHTVTLAIPLVIDGDRQVPSRAVAIPAGAQVAIPVIDLYRDPTTGRAVITYDAVTSVTVAVIRVATS